MTPLYPPIVLGISCLIGEAENQGRPGMVAVAEVIRNRMEKRYASDGTVAGTVLRPKQFSCFDEKWRARLFQLRWDEPSVVLARQAWDIAFNDDGTGRRSDTVGGAVLYHTIQAPVSAARWPPVWATAPGVVETARVQAHVFYRDNGR